MWSEIGVQIVADVELRESTDGGTGGLGVYARAAAASGDVILRAPLRGCLTLANPRLREGAETMGLLCELARHGAQCKLAAMVAIEMTRRSIAFAAWLERWPRPIEGSLGWRAGGEEWRRLAAGLGDRSVRVLHEQHLAMASRAWTEVIEPSVSRAAAGGESTGEPDAVGSLTWERWLYALSMVLSRALDLRVNDESELAIVPLIDMLNHTRSSADSCHVRFDPSAQAFELVASVPITEGAELKICYGAKGNEELLACYGFALGENGADRLGLALPFGRPDEPQILTMHRMAMLPSPVVKVINLREVEGSGRVATLEVHWDEQRKEARLADEMLLLLRLSVLDMGDLPSITLALEGEPVSADAEARAWSALCTAAAAALDASQQREAAVDDSIDVLDRSLRELAEAVRRLALRKK